MIVRNLSIMADALLFCFSTSAAVLMPYVAPRRALNVRFTCAACAASFVFT
jgi:hypothetical protein